MKNNNTSKYAKKIDAKLIDKAYAFCEQMFQGDTEAFQKYWYNNYVKFINDFAMKKYNKSALLHQAYNDEENTQLN